MICHRTNDDRNNMLIIFIARVRIYLIFKEMAQARASITQEPGPGFLARGTP